MINTKNIKNKELKNNIEKLFNEELISLWYDIKFLNDTENNTFISVNIKCISGKIITNNAIETVKNNLLILNYKAYAYEIINKYISIKFKIEK